MIVEEVIFRKLDNIALGKPSALSSIDDGSNASLAVDGNTATGLSICASSKVEINAWLRVDLLASAVIRSIRILSYEAQYRVMENIDVRAGNSSDNGGKGNPPCQSNVAFPSDSNIVEVKCPENTVARYITIYTSSSSYDYLRICELEVYGFYV